MNLTPSDLFQLAEKVTSDLEAEFFENCHFSIGSAEIGVYRFIKCLIDLSTESGDNSQ
jgi:hypothetical protein